MKVCITTSYGHWGSFSPTDLFSPGAENMIGGGETAMLWQARALAKAGHDVKLFYDVRRPGNYYGIDFLPKAFKIPFITSYDFDVLISWEDVESLGVRHRADLVIYSIQCNSMQIGVLDHGIDWYQCVSEWHVNQMFSSDRTVDPNKFFIVPNGVDLERYNQKPIPERIPNRVIHSSSPDRGLHHLLDIWPEIKRRIPDSELHVFYDMQNWFNIVDWGNANRYGISTADTAGRVRAGIEKAEKAGGLVLRGPVGQWELAKEQQMASLMVYPCDPIAPTEGFSISILEAMAAGTPVVTSNADALGELWRDCTTQIPLPFEGKDALWVQEIMGLLTDKPRWERMSREGKVWAKDYSWNSIGREYVGLVKEKLADKRRQMAGGDALSETAVKALIGG